MTHLSRSHHRTGTIQPRAALVRLKGIDLVVVLGHPWYYPRFGFRPAHLMGLTSEYNSSPENFMVLELTPGILSTCAGLVRYHHAFDKC